MSHEHTLTGQTVLDGEILRRCVDPACRAWFCPDCARDFAPPRWAGNAPRGWRVHRAKCKARTGIESQP